MTLRFLHVAKTAGSTITYLLVHNYSRKDWFAFTGNIDYDIRRYYALPEIERRSIKLFTGHSPISTGVYNADRARIITLLRDPIKRVKSFCQHVSEGKSPHLLKEFPPDSFDLDRFLASKDGELSNLQTKMLVNHGSCVSSELIEKMSPSEVQGMAVDNLFHKIARFGLQEYFDESLVMFSSYLGWPTPLYFSLNPRNPFRLLEFKKRHIEQIEELNALDIEVYKAAKIEFAKRLQSEEFDQVKLKNLRSIQIFLSPAQQIWVLMKSLNAASRSFIHRAYS